MTFTGLAFSQCPVSSRYHPLVAIGSVDRFCPKAAPRRKNYPYETTGQSRSGLNSKQQANQIEVEQKTGEVFNSSNEGVGSRSMIKSQLQQEPG